MTIAEALKTGIHKLNDGGIENPSREAALFLKNILKRDEVFIYTNGTLKIEKAQTDLFFKSIERRIKGEPYAYIVGHKEFMGLNFEVTKDVLIPRCDTEVLVQSVMDYCEKIDNDKIYILDIGTGSGCIALSLAKYIKNSVVFATDVSETALLLAKKNAEALSLLDRTFFIKADILKDEDDLLQSLSLQAGTLMNGRFDVVVSNPPYINTDEIKTLQREVKDFEPMLALDGGTDGLGFYKQIIKKASMLLKPDGFIALEVGINQAKSVEVFLEKEYHYIEKIKDLAGIDRIVNGRKRIF